MRYRLEELFDLQMGKTPARANPDYWNGSNKWVSISDLSSYDKYVTDTKECISDLGVSESCIKAVPQNTVIMSFKLSIGKTAITTEDIYTNEAIMAFIDKGVCEIDTDYLYYLFSGLDWNKGTNKAVLGLTLNKATLSKKEIDIPDLHTQNEVVKKLDSLSNVIQLQKQSLDKLDELIKSRFVEMFGDIVINTKQWECKVFSEITSSRLGKMLDTKQCSGQELYPYLANFNVQWFRFDFTKLNEMDFNEKDRVEFHLEDGDLLVCEGGEIGRCAIWHNEIENCYFQKALHRVRCNKNYITPMYLAWWFKFMCDGGGFSDIEGAKATISHLPGAKLKKLSVVVPPIELQYQFAHFVTQVEKQKATVQQSIDKLKTLKKSLMQEYFG